MIDKVVEILLSKLVQPRTRKERAEDEVKRRLVFLHEALVNCHNTYKEFASKRTDMERGNWVEAVNDLARTLDDVGLALSSFAPDAFDYASRYLLQEMPPNNTGEAQELERTVRRLELLETGKPKAKDGNDFKQATQRLRKFMKEHMTAGEIQKAQEDFRRDTYRKYL